MLTPPGVPDPRLREILSQYPDELFDASLWASCEWVDRYATALAYEVAGELGILEALSSPRSATQLADALRFAPPFLPALEWLLKTLHVAGVLTSVGDPSPAYQTTPSSLPSARGVRDAALADAPASAATLDLYAAAASFYPRVARGETSGESALFGPSTSSLWLRYFDNQNPPYAICNRLAGEVAARALGDRESPRILEIGGGVGGGAEALLDALQLDGGRTPVRRYDFTEPSPFFRRRGERLLRAKFPSLELASGDLDMTKPWAAQGAADGTFDLVYAVNVLHVADDLPQVLRAARRALKSGGWLVAGECMPLFDAQPVSAEIAFRLLASFNGSAQASGRPHSGFLQPDAWRQLLEQAGFERVAVEPDLDRLRHVYPRFFAGVVLGHNASAAPGRPVS